MTINARKHLLVPLIIEMWCLYSFPTLWCNLREHAIFRNDEARPINTNVVEEKFSKCKNLGSNNTLILQIISGSWLTDWQGRLILRPSSIPSESRSRMPSWTFRTRDTRSPVKYLRIVADPDCKNARYVTYWVFYNSYLIFLSSVRLTGRKSWT